MNSKQKVLFAQLQMAGAGLIILAFGLFRENMPISIVGGLVMLYSISRLILINKVLKNADFSDKELEEYNREQK